MMAAYSDSLGFFKGTAAYPANVTDISKFEVTVDFAAVKAARTAAGATALAATDTLEVITLPAGSVVLSAGMNVLSLETVNDTATIDIGFTGGTPAAANAYGDDLVTNTTGLKAANLANPTVVIAADTIDILLNTAVPEDAVIKFFAIVANAN
jgi:hypothetical protein